MSVFGILLVSLLGALQASVLPEDFDETILLQRKYTTRSQHAAPILQQPLELAQDNMAEQLDAIDKFLQEQDPDDGGDSDGDGDGDGDAGGTDLNSVKQMLEDQMEAYLLALHTAAQSEWSTATGGYTACGTHRERRFDNIIGDVVLAERAMHQARLKHQACRRSEKAWNTFRAMSYSPPADLAVHNVDDAATAFCEAMSNAQALAQTYNDVVPVGKHECLVDQTSFEWSACTWEAKATEACNAYTTCTAATGLTDLKNRLRVDSAERRALWRTIGILKCRIDEVADGAAGTDDGDSESADPCADLNVNTAHLVLELPDPQPDDCTDEQLPPLMSPSIEDSAQCAVWTGTEYSWEPSEAVVPVACAATCLGVHPPQPPSNCEDVNGQCEFYQLHPSACGSFPADGQAFDACTDCCYCRFSPACGHCPPGYIVHQGGTACQECPEGQIPNADSTSCVDPQPCVAGVHCSGHGTTVDLDMSDGCSCSCGGGYSGVDCSTPPPCDATVDCSGHGATIDLDSTDGCECACDAGFEGADCSDATDDLALPSGFEYSSSSCSTGPGALWKSSGNQGQWSCFALETRTSVMPSGPGPRGFSFECPDDTNSLVHIGLQKAKCSDVEPIPSHPDTWDDTCSTSTNSNLKDVLYAVDNDGVYNQLSDRAFDAGFGCIFGSGSPHYHNTRQRSWGSHVGRTMTLLADGNQFKWYVDGELIKTETGIEGVRSSSTIEGPLWVVAVVGSVRPGHRPIQNFRFVTAESVA